MNFIKALIFILLLEGQPALSSEWLSTKMKIEEIESKILSINVTEKNKDNINIDSTNITTDVMKLTKLDDLKFIEITNEYTRILEQSRSKSDDYKIKITFRKEEKGIYYKKYTYISFYIDENNNIVKSTTHIKKIQI